MTNRNVLLQEIKTLPIACLDEVVDFVAWIKHRKFSQIPETMLLCIFLNFYLFLTLNDYHSALMILKKSK